MSKKAKNDDDELKLEDCQNFEGVFEEDKQLKLPLPVAYIRHEEDNAVIYQRHEDGYVNATAMCKATGKTWYAYYRLDTTKEFIAELSTSLKNPKRDKHVTDIIITQRGGDPVLQGTWIHPDLAVHLAMWLSPKFAVKVARWVNEWVSGKNHKPNIPYHVKRYYMNEHAIPEGHFSILQEMGLRFFSKFEIQGYHLPSNLVPDISVGRMFAGWLRKQGVNVDEMPSYKHRYEDGRVFPAKAYPMVLFTAFHAHLNKVWIPKRSYKYFAERDKAALPYLNKLLDSYSNPIRLTPIGGGSCK
jgi:hypothetical protein